MIVSVDTAEIAELYSLSQEVLVLKRHGSSVERAVRAKMRWERRWERALTVVWGRPVSDGQVDELIGVAERDWETGGLVPPWMVVQKGPIGDSVKHMLRTMVGTAIDFARGVMPVYMSLAEDTAEDAGQYTLDTLGLNETWKWTSTRDMARDWFAVRGSKVIQNAYGSHLDELRRIIIEATDPTHPSTQTETREEIRKRWEKLTVGEVARIARTETGAVWETTNYNTQRANGVDTFSWVIAHGPSVGPPKSQDVCPICTAAAAAGPYSVPNVPMPPAHPNCRCTLVPDLTSDWLPPAETWSGGPEPPLPLSPAPEPTMRP
jgi:hypothetical protein